MQENIFWPEDLFWATSLSLQALKPELKSKKNDEAWKQGSWDASVMKSLGSAYDYSRRTTDVPFISQFMSLVGRHNNNLPVLPF